MKRILTRPTLLLRRLHIRPDNAVADRTLRLPLQRPLDIPPESDQPLDQTSRGEDDDLEGAQPGLPVFVGDADAVARCDEGLLEGVGARQRDGEADGWGFVVDGDGGDELGGARGGFEGYGAVVRVLG